MNVAKDCRYLILWSLSDLCARRGLYCETLKLVSKGLLIILIGFKGSLKLPTFLQFRVLEWAILKTVNTRPAHSVSKTSSSKDAPIESDVRILQAINFV